MATAPHPSLEAALGAVLARCPSTIRIVVANSFGLPILSPAAPGHDNGGRAVAATDGDAAVRFGVSADALEKLGYGKVLGSVLVCAPGNSGCPAGADAASNGVGGAGHCNRVLVQHALFPLVVTVELAVGPHAGGTGDGDTTSGAPVATGGDVEALQSTLLPALAGVLEPLRAEAEAQTG